MSNATLFINPLANTQFFSVVNSIIILGKILYNEKQLAIETKVEPITIINDLCKFLLINNQREEKILELGHKLLQETDLYGSKKNEILHIKFVNAMLNNIIANIIFSKYGNTFGYLSAIVNSTDDIKLSSVKKKIIQNLQMQTFVNYNGSISMLTNITIARITKNILFPLFPKPEKNMEIIHLKYLYAQAGWLLLLNAQENNRNTSFSKLISLAQHVEQGVLQGKIDSSALQIFQLPALLYYTYQKNNGIKRHNLKTIMVSKTFWNRVYDKFFANLHFTFEKIIALQKLPSAYRFIRALLNFQNRTSMAEGVLRKNCPNETDYASKIIDYKNNPKEYYCNEQLLPDINKMFAKQIEIIGRKYFAYENNLIHQVFDDDLKKFINQANVTIKPIEVFWHNQCFKCGILSQRPQLSNEIDLFQISDGGEKKMIYALIRNKNGMKLVSATDINYFLVNEIGLNERAQLNVPFMAEDMKSASDDSDFNIFVTYIAKYREKKLLANLKSIGYDATTIENVVNFFKHLIPFYSCADAIHDSDTSTHEAAMACIFDSLVFLPVLGFGTSVSMKITSATIRSTVLTLGAHMETFSLKEAFKAIIKVGFRIIAMDVIDSFSQIITKEFIRNFGIAILRTLDPGIEFSSMLIKAGVRSIISGWKHVKNKVSDVNLMGAKDVKIGTYMGHDIKVNSVTGQDGFGFKTLDYNGWNVELRKVRGYKNEIPVVVVSKGRMQKKYKKIDLETGKLDETEWIEDGEVLIVASKPLAVRTKIIVTEGLSGRGYSTSYRRIKAMESMQKEKSYALKIIANPLDQQLMKKTLENYVLEHFGNCYTKFVNFWLEFKTIPTWAEDFKLIDPKSFYNIRFTAYLEDVSLRRSGAIDRLVTLYGKEYLKTITNFDLDILFNFYITKKLHDVITFSNQFAIANFITSGFSKVHLDDLEAWQMRRALYTTALRQFDSSNLFFSTNNKVLYSSDVKILTEIFPIEKGKIIDIREFTILNREKDELLPNLKLVNDDNLVKIIHQFKIRHHCLTVYLERYLPFNTQHIVLIPGIQLHLDNWEFQIIEGQKILVMEWKNVDIIMSQWLAKISNRIKFIADREQTVIGNIQN